MRIRRYYGFDCDSVNGFNNGHFIDKEPIEVEDFYDAREKCLEFLEKQWGPLPESLIRLEEDCVELITGFFDEEGCAIDEADFNTEKNHSYSYVYVMVQKEKS